MQEVAHGLQVSPLLSLSLHNSRGNNKMVLQPGVDKILTLFDRVANLVVSFMLTTAIAGLNLMSRLCSKPWKAVCAPMPVS